jgi:hypothetical protein
MDPAILAAIEMTMPPSPPQIVEERPWLSTLAQRGLTIQKQLIDQYRRAVDSWMAELIALGNEAESARPAIKAALDSETLSSLEEAIANMETVAEIRARALAKLRKRAPKKTKRVRSFDPSLARVLYRGYHELVEIDEKVIDALLEHALVLRALKAEVDPASKGGPTFNSPDELRRYLARTAT